MALEYALIVPGTATPEQLWPRLYGARHRPPEPIVRKGVWTTQERERSGFRITLHRGAYGYFDIGEWLREPDEHLHVGFRADRDAFPQRLARNLLELVHHVLDSGRRRRVAELHRRGAHPRAHGRAGASPAGRLLGQRRGVAGLTSAGT